MQHSASRISAQKPALNFNATISAYSALPRDSSYSDSVLTFRNTSLDVSILSLTLDIGIAVARIAL